MILKRYVTNNQPFFVGVASSQFDREQYNADPSLQMIYFFAFFSHTTCQNIYSPYYMTLFLLSTTLSRAGFCVLTLDIVQLNENALSIKHLSSAYRSHSHKATKRSARPIFSVPLENGMTTY